MNPVIVVEGRDDTRRLREIYPDIETIETNGSAIDEETIAFLEKLKWWDFSEEQLDAAIPCLTSVHLEEAKEELMRIKQEMK